MNVKRSFSVYVVVAAVVATLCFNLSTHPAAAQGAWYAEYFSNASLAGGPALTRYEGKLDFAWNTGSPGAGIPADGFSARFTRDEWFESGTYRFSYRSDDGIRVWVGDTLVVDDWRDRQATLVTVDRVISRGTQRVRVEYYEHTGGASLQLAWERVSGGAGWRGEYFSNRDLSSAPAVVRYDAAIDFDWGTGSPDPVVPADNFSVRWTHILGFTAGTYRFNSSSDDGVRIYVDGRNIVDAWSDGKLPNNRSGDVTLTEGQHTVVVEYYEHGGDASAHVWWDRLGYFAGWEGRYYDDPDLRGGPTLVRDDAEISFDWGEGAPATWMPSDNFSAVWTRQVNFAPGFYRFNVRSDDGARVWLDKGLIMDYWRPQDYQWNYAGGFYLEGVHTLKVEYFEQTGSARVRFWWDVESTVPSTVVPTPAPAPTPIPGTGVLPGALGSWTGEYFANRELAGSPAVVRNDATLNFDWGWGAPTPELARDNFSVRWTGSFQFETGHYSFNTYSDDGVRVYVDDRRVIDGWRAMRGYRSAAVSLNAGTHAIRVEYFERTGRANVRFWWILNQKTGATTIGETQPSGAKAGGPLKLDAWPVGSYCTSGGWVAKVFVEGRGGDGLYTYTWERVVQGRMTPQSLTFEVKSAGWGNAIVGEVSVMSAGQTVKVGLYIPSPQCP